MFQFKRSPIVTSTIIVKKGDAALISRVTEDDIREEAYRIWENEGCQGDSIDHWLRAKEIVEKKIISYYVDIN